MRHAEDSVDIRLLATFWDTNQSGKEEELKEKAEGVSFAHSRDASSTSLRRIEYKGKGYFSGRSHSFKAVLTPPGSGNHAKKYEGLWHEVSKDLDTDEVFTDATSAKEAWDLEAEPHINTDLTEGLPKLRDVDLALPLLLCLLLFLPLLSGLLCLSLEVT
ncbi:hypothetical protein LXA43DRAFT_1099911 [Ganoderma leucocontextum]|nr:hypothetical protein LXA43DRAFT_1099911 [Ganoderma leucocontextum]